MLDIKFIRENTELVRQAIVNRHDTTPLDEILRVDSERRKTILELEELRRMRKETSRERQAEAAEAGRNLRNRIRDLEDEAGKLEAQLQELVLQVPNIPHPSVPIGQSEADNVVVRSCGSVRQFDFPPKPHWELGEALDIIDFARGVKLSGTRFYVLKGLGARLQRALIAFFLDVHTTQQGYREIYPPFMVKREFMVGAGQLPKLADNIYHDAEEDFWFVGTAEIPLTGLHSGEILPPGTLPLRYVAYTPCFRREKMSAGKDTRGIKRGHQFDKVEMYKLSEPEKSEQELELLLHDAEAICQQLGLAYRIKLLCTADISFASTKTYDIEVWAPGCNEWLEVSSCSNCGDFQARRSNIRYRPAAGEKPLYLHTLNGSGLALPRVFIAVMENYQQADGSILVPGVLQSFMRTDVIK